MGLSVEDRIRLRRVSPAKQYVNLADGAESDEPRAYIDIAIPGQASYMTRCAMTPEQLLVLADMCISAASHMLESDTET